MWFVAQLAEHLAVNEAVVGSNPIDPPKMQLSVVSVQWSDQGLPQKLATDNRHLTTVRGIVAEGLMHFPVEEDDDGSSPFGPAKFRGRLAETDQRRPEEPKSLARYQERPPFH